MSVLDTKFVQGFVRMCNDGWEQGWHERNGGNLSYRIKDEEVAEVFDASINRISAWVVGFRNFQKALYMHC